jgi:thiol-disulfide isomerase/thioredoxin
MPISAWACQAMTLDDFQKYLNHKKPKKIVFFASWCLACKDSLLHLNEDDILVSAFDEVERSRRVLKSLGLVQACFYGEEIVQHYKVKKLPRSILLD